MRSPVKNFFRVPIQSCCHSRPDVRTDVPACSFVQPMGVRAATHQDSGYILLMACYAVCALFLPHAPCTRVVRQA